MSDPSAPARSAEEALGRARRHARAAVAESVAAARAVLDALALGLSGAPAEAHRTLGTLARALDEIGAALSERPGEVSAPLVRSILDALDQEIARWEKCSTDDADARAVLRAFIGVREILWELGLRRGGESPPAGAEPPDRTGRRPAPAPVGDASGDRKRPRGRRAPRVERVKVQGC
jgi:hypothetical protein